jgi:hypothetical protein
MRGFGAADFILPAGAVFVSHAALVDALGWDPAPYTLSAGATVYMAPRSTAPGGVTVHWRLLSGESGSHQAAFGTDAEERAAYAAQAALMAGKKSSGAGTAWLPYAVGALLVGAVGFFWWDESLSRSARGQR